MCRNMATGAISPGVLPLVRKFGKPITPSRDAL